MNKALLKTTETVSSCLLVIFNYEKMHNILEGDGSLILTSAVKVIPKDLRLFL